MKEQLEAIANVVRSCWRYRWSALLVIVLACVLGSVLVLALPATYESHAQIYVDTKSVLRPLLQGIAVPTQARDETDVVRQALLARPTLDKVAQRTAIYSRTATPEGREGLLRDLAHLIVISGDSSVGLYSISFTDRDPRMAQSIVDTLLNTFLENSVSAGRADSQNAEKFLAQQVLEYEQRLSQSERGLADFKKKNIGLMPDQHGDYFSRLQGQIAARTKLQSDLAVAIQQRDELRRKIAGESGGANGGLTPPPTNQQIQSAVALDSRIREAKVTLDQLLDKFTDRHPQVISQKEMIRRLEEQRQIELGGVRQTNGTKQEGSSIVVDAVVQNLQIALNNADVQVATLQTQLHQAESQVNQLQQTVTTGPEIEAELARLNRDYGVTKAQYEALLQRLESARISNDVDRTEELRFKVLEPPRLPLRPFAPNRTLLMMGVLAVALVLGFGVALVRSQANPVFNSKTSVTDVLKVPVIGAVTRAFSAADRAARRRDHFAYAAALGGVICVVLATAAFSYKASQIFRAIAGLGVG